MTTARTITTAQIKALRSEARAAGDVIMVDFCDLALAYTNEADSSGDALINPLTGLRTTRAVARRVCADAINAAAANA